MALENPHQQAALTYVSLGILVIVITFVAGLVPTGRDNPLLELGIGATFLVIFAMIVYRGWWPVTALLLISNSGRVFTYSNDGLGRHVELRPYSVTQIEPQPVAFINTLLMVVVVVMLARAAYVWIYHLA